MASSGAGLGGGIDQEKVAFSISSYSTGMIRAVGSSKSRASSMHCFIHSWDWRKKGKGTRTAPPLSKGCRTFTRSRISDYPSCSFEVDGMRNLQGIDYWIDTASRSDSQVSVALDLHLAVLISSSPSGAPVRWV